MPFIKYENVFIQEPAKKKHTQKEQQRVLSTTPAADIP